MPSISAGAGCDVEVAAVAAAWHQLVSDSPCPESFSALDDHPSGYPAWLARLTPQDLLTSGYANRVL